MKKLCFLLMMCLLSLTLLTACTDQKSLDEARTTLETFFDLRQAGEVHAAKEYLTAEYRQKFEADPRWNEPATLRSVNAFNAKMQYQILEVKPLGKDVVISVHLITPDLKDAKRQIMDTMKNVDVEAYQNAGYSQAEFEKMMNDKMFRIIQSGNYKMLEQDGDFLLTKENGAWKVSNELKLVSAND